MSVLISVIIPVYNTDRYLRRCMESVLNQSYRNLEIICIDDGSTDESGAMLDAYAAQDSRVRVVHQENMGQTAARKVGVGMATGDYVSYVDSDDAIALTRYEELLDRGIRQRADIIFADLTEVFGDGSQIKIKNYFNEGVYPKGKIEDEILTHLCDPTHFFVYILRTYGPCVLYSRKLISFCQNNVSDDIIFGEDIATLLLCVVKAESIYMAHAGMYYYFKNIGSTCHIREETEHHFQKVWRSNRALYKHFGKLLLQCPERLHTQVAREFTEIMFFETLLHDYQRVVRVLACDDMVFPFGVSRNCRVVIYGAGSFGVQLYRYMSNQGLPIVLWCDRAWESFRVEGDNVSNPEDMKSADFDYVLMAIAQYEVAEKAARDLVKMGIPESKIRFIDAGELSQERLQKIYG